MWWRAAVVVVLALCVLAMSRGSANLNQAREELAQVRSANQTLDQENRLLYRQVQRLRDDPQALELACRTEMQLVRPDEVVYEEHEASAAPAAGQGGSQP